MLQLEQKRIQRALVHGKKVAADLLNAARDAIAVERPEQIKSFEDHQGEVPCRTSGFSGIRKLLLVSNISMPQYLLESNRNVAGELENLEAESRKGHLTGETFTRTKLPSGMLHYSRGS